MVSVAIEKAYLETTSPLQKKKKKKKCCISVLLDVLYGR